MEKLVTLWLEHCQRWGRVWFGTLFWGSVLGAGYHVVVPDGGVLPVYAVSGGIGAALGLVAQARGRWV